MSRSAATSKKTPQRRRSTKTPEERRAEIAELIARRDAQVEQLRTSGGWERFLSAVVPLRRFSWGNLLLILAARPDATDCRGWAQWIERGRKVRPEEAKNWIGILAPWTKRWAETDPETGEEVERSRLSWLRVRVYDIAQTDPIDGAQPAAVLEPASVGLADPVEVFAVVGHHLAQGGWSVTREVPEHGAMGYTVAVGRRVVVSPEVGELDQALTLIHEAGHIELGHMEEAYSEYLAHRGRYEVEAESVAYVLGAILGLGEHLSQIAYIIGWAEQAESDVLATTCEHITEAVHRLANALLGPGS